MPAGRPKGSLNGTTAKAKAAIEECFTQLGGVDSLVLWARENLTDFYKIIYPKLLPLQVSGDPDNPLIIEEIRRTIVDTGIANTTSS